MGTKINLYKQSGTDDGTSVKFNVPRSLTYGLNARANDDGGVSESDNCTYNTLNDLVPILNSASLVVTPSSYKEGKLYSVIPSDGSGDFTFTRATTATRVNSDGLVELVPYNLLPYSEQFDNAAWTQTNVSVTPNTTTAPDGTLTADTLSIGVDASSTRHRLATNSVTSQIVNTIYTGTYYLKANQHQWIQILGNIGYSTGVWANFDLINGVIGNTGGVDTTASIESVGNGWYRCRVSGLSTVTLTTGFEILTINNTNSGRYPSYQSLVAEDVCYIWGAQLNEGTILPYQKTETRLNIPRIDYSLGGCPSILLEPQRTNLLQRSEEFNNAYWNKNGGSISANSSTAPNGTLTADRLTLAATTATHGLIDFGVGGVAASTYTVSFYVKKGTHRYITIGIYRNTLNNAGAGFDLDTNTVTGTGATGTGYSASGATMTDVGDGWYRCSVVCVSGTTPMTGSCLFLRNTSYTSGAIQESWAASGTETINLWGAQAEVGAYATSYIPTTTASVTRNQDVCLKTGASALIGQTEGTLYAEFNLTNLVGDRTILEIGADNSNRIRIRINGNTISASVVLAGSVVFSITFNSQPLGNYKIAYAYKQNDFQAYLNGNAGTAVTSGNIPSSMSIIGVGTRIVTADIFNDSISTAALWKERLTNDQLAQLTTI